MIDKEINDALNKQIQEELNSAYIYLAMVAYFEDLNLPGFSSWMKNQSNEEVGHAMRLFNFVNERGGRVVLQSIPEPPTNWGSPLEAFRDAYNHEVHISGCINKLLELARKKNDYATEVHLHWFVDEQVEEEDTTSLVVNKLGVIGDSGPGLLMLDAELGRRQGDIPPSSSSWEESGD